MTFLSAWWLWAGLLAGPILLLHLLKMRREPRRVASTLLWSQVLTDLRANTPFRRLRRYLLLLLQLLVLSALVAALAQPVVQGRDVGGESVVVILDASASMQARDVGDGRSRFDKAVEQAEALINGLERGDRMMLVVAGPAGRGSRSAFTSNRAQLRDLLRNAGPFDAPASLAEALRLAVSSLAGQDGSVSGRVILLSDGVGVTLPDVPALPAVLHHVRIGSASENIGIVSVAVAPAEGGDQQATVTVRNFGDQARSTSLSFYFGSPTNWLDTRAINLPAGGQETVTLTRALPPGRLWVRVEGAEDSFPLDDVAYALLPEPRKPFVRFISTGNPAIVRYLAAGQRNGLFDGEVVAPAEAADASRRADLTIYDGALPAEDAIPERDVLFIRPTRAVAGFTPAGGMASVQMIRQRSDAAVLRFVDLNTLAVAKAVRYEHQGLATELVSAVSGPLIAYTSSGPARRYLLAFDLADSSWSTDPGLLVFLSNLVERAAAAHFVGRSQMIATAMPAELGKSTAGTEVLDPTGRRNDVPAGATRFAGTTTSGFYEVSRPGANTAFAANLFSPVESDIGPKRLADAAGQAVFTSEGEMTVDRPLWPWLAAAALAVLTLEWFVHHRRPFTW